MDFIDKTYDKTFIASNMKETGLKGYVHNFSIDYTP